MTPVLVLGVTVMCAYVFFKGSELWSLVAFVIGIAFVIVSSQ